MFTAGAGSTSIDVRSVWFLLLYASQYLDKLTGREREVLLSGERDNDLLDALGDVLSTQVESRMRSMLARGYRNRAGSLTRVRGRIDHLGTARGRLLDSGRILCRYTEQTVDLFRYRHILVTLRRAARAAASDTTKGKVLRTAQMLERNGVTPIDPTGAQMSREQYGHFDAEDRKLVLLSELVRQMCAPEHAPGRHSLPAIVRDERVLRILFEAAVRGYYRHHLGKAGFRVESSSRSWPSSGDAAALAFLPRLNADVVITGQGRQVVIECKFAPVFGVHRNKTMLSPEYVRQIYAYARAFAGSFNGTTETVLLGALVRDSPGRDLDLTLDGIPLRVRQVDLSAAPSDIRRVLASALQLNSPAS